MKTLLEAMHNLKEAKPSVLKKTRNKDQDIHYEPTEGDYEHVPFDYTLHGGEYEGYINDKKGNRYTVVASHRESDTGAIAGGTTNYNVTIAYGEHKINLSSYTAIFSNNDGAGYRLFTDLQNGMYLEDYLQKNLKELSGVSNIGDWVEAKEESGEKLSRWGAIELWVKENVIGDNEDYDERTSFQKRVDKKNQKKFVSLRDSIPIYIDGQEIKIGRDIKESGKRYTGRKGYDKFVSSDESIEIKKGTILLLDEEVKNRIFDSLITKGEFDFEVTLEDIKDIIFELDDLDTIFQVNGNKLKPVHKIFDRGVHVFYRPINGDNRWVKIDELLKQAKLEPSYNRSIPRMYKEIQSRLGGAKESIVEIVYDRSKHENRAQGNDGVHGKAWVQFPKDLRIEGKKYKVDQLIWNGKNYRVKGNIEEV